MGLRKINKVNRLNVKEVSMRRNETFMEVAGRLLKEYESNANPSLLIETQKLLEFVIEDIQLRNTSIRTNKKI